MLEILDRIGYTRRRSISAAFAAAVVLFALLMAPFASLQVMAATPTPTPSAERVYLLGGATESEVKANLNDVIFQDSIDLQLNAFEVKTDSTAARVYLQRVFDGSLTIQHLIDDYFRQFNDFRSTGIPVIDGSLASNEYALGILGRVHVSISGGNGAAYDKSCVFSIVWGETRSQRAAVRSHVRAFLSSAAYPADGTDEQKLTAINTYITSTFSYDLSLTNSTAFSMIDMNSTHLQQGTCQAYSLYGYAMLAEAGFTARTLFSRTDGNGVRHGPEAYPSSSVGWSGHSWLLVRVGGRWYHMDFTWNDPTGAGSKPNRNYYMLSDSQIGKDHRWKWTDPVTGKAFYPAADTTWSGVAVSPTPSPTPKPTAAPTPKPTSAPTQKPTQPPFASPSPSPSEPSATAAAETTPSQAVEPAPSDDTDPSATSSAEATPHPTYVENELVLSPMPTDDSNAEQIKRLSSSMDFGRLALAALHNSWQESPVETAVVASGSLAVLLSLVLLASRAKKRRRNR